MNNSTTLQLSNSEIKDRTLTKNLARILMEDEDVEKDSEIVSWGCPSKIEQDVEQNNYLQKYRFVVSTDTRLQTKGSTLEQTKPQKSIFSGEKQNFLYFFGFPF